MNKKVMMAAPFSPNGRYNGGISYVVNELAKETQCLEQNGIELSRFETCRVNRENSAIGSFNFLNIKNALKIYFDLPGEISMDNSEILYFHTSFGMALLKDILAIRRAKKKTKIKTVLHIHFAEYAKIMTGKNAVDQLMLRWLKKYVDHIVFLSKNTMAEFVSHGIDENKCSVIYNFSSFDYAKEKIFDKVSSDVVVPQFLFVGSIDERKGIFDVLECMTDMDNDFVLHICGACGNDKDEERFNKYRELLGEKLVFHGYVNGAEKEKVYFDSDILLLPSYGEGLPIVILEAYSAACAVIATNVGAIPEVVGDSNGTLIVPGDKALIKETLLRYLNDQDKLLKSKQKYNYEISEQFSLEAFIKNVSDVCDKVKLK